jgi:Trk K+ transport system NAD-binding subunit
MVNDPYKQLVAMLETLIGRHVARAAAGITCELGTITATGLKLDGFKHEIRNYLVSEHLTLDEPVFTKTKKDGAHKGSCPDGSVSGDAHEHEVITPPQLLPLHPGDRVLVVPVHHGQDFVVIARVVPNA